MQENTWTILNNPTSKKTMTNILGGDLVGRIEFRRLTADRVKEVIALQQLTMKQESIAIGVGMWEDPGAADEIKLLFQEVIKDGVSIIAVDKKTQQVAGVAFNKLHALRDDNQLDALDLFIQERMRHRASLDLIQFLSDVEAPVDIFQRYNVKGAMEIFYIGTDPKFQGQGIATKIVSVSLDLGKRLLRGELQKVPIAGVIANKEILPEVAFGVFASDCSQRIARNLKFQTLNEVSYDNFSFGGKKMSERIGKLHKTAVLAAYRF